jgi:hypothetical protein
MRGRARRQTPRRTRVQLKRTLSSDGRAWVKEVWEAAEIEQSRLPTLDPLTQALATCLAERYADMEQLDGDEIRQALVTALMTGYASRRVLAGPTDQPRLDPSALPGEALSLNAQHDADGVAELAESLEGIALDELPSVMTLPEQIWSAYLALAALQLQGRLSSSTLTWRELTAERIEAMLRYGYVLRCFDEALETETGASSGQT